MSTPINMLQNPAHSAANIQTQKMEMAQHEIKGLGQTKLNDAEKAAKLRDTCENFESIFIQKMWQQMRATLPQENPLVGREEKFWQSMYDQEFSKKMAEGGGIGLADMMYEQLSENLFNVSKTTAGANRDGKGFEIDVAPMIPSASLHAAPPTSLTQEESALKAQDVAKVENQKGQNSEQKFAALYENVPSPQGSASSVNTGAAQENTAAVQQFLSTLQAKQGNVAAQSQTLTGPERAALVQQQVGSPPPSNGVLPASSVSKVTYTTNVPKGQRSGDAESHMKDLMAKAAATNAAQNPAGVGGSWQQASAQQQASYAVQEALRKAQDIVATEQQVAQNTVGQAGGSTSNQTLPLTPPNGQVASQVTGQVSGVTNPSHPYTIPPTPPVDPRQRS